MKRVYFATRVRGFFRHLLNCQAFEWEFKTSDMNMIYETQGKKSKLISKVARLKFFDWIGLIQVINCQVKKAEIYGSFNRFLKTDKPYFIYLENPTAVYHYRLGRNKSFLGKRKVNKLLSDENLKAIICLSKACSDTFEDVCDINRKFKGIKKVIYPYIPENTLTTKELIGNRCQKELKLLYVAQGDRFISKGAPEIIDAFKKLKEKYESDISLTIITSIDVANQEVLKSAQNISGINVLDFKLDPKEMMALYNEHSVLLHPTSDDSSALTILEAMKAGLPIISTTLYAIPEMVKDGVNGYLTNPKWSFFDENNIPNPRVWNNRKKTIHNTCCDKKTSLFLFDRIETLLNDRNLLFKMSMNSLEISNSKPFDLESIANSWNEVLDEINVS